MQEGKGVQERAASIERATGSSHAPCWCASVETQWDNVWHLQGQAFAGFIGRSLEREGVQA